MLDEDEVYRALRKANQARERCERELAEVRASLNQLVDILVGKGALNPGQARLIAKVGEKAAEAERPRVKLRVLDDKYQLAGADIDCASRLHLCHGRCCAFSFALTEQDLEEGVVRWELEDPYRIRHDADGFCTHLDRATLGCTVYDKRPGPCRQFDCRGDQRVWIDFEARIPAPMPEGLRPLR